MTCSSSSRRASTQASKVARAAAAYDYATTFDSRYIARYRDPAQHDIPPVRHRTSRVASQFPFASSSSLYAAPINASTAGTTLSTASANHGMPISAVPRRPKQDTESTVVGSSKDRSAAAQRSASNSKGKAKETALLFPGSGSQYVGMNAFLDKYKSARETWDEAEDALEGFEKWRKDLKLHELPELEHLDLLSWPTWQKERSKEELRQVVTEGPQVCDSLGVPRMRADLAYRTS